MKKTLLSLVAILVFTSFANAQIPAQSGLWKFDDPDHLFVATIGNDLVPTDEATNYALAGPYDGNGAIANVRARALTMIHGLDANGGGTRLNEYTLQWDVMLPDIDLWRCLIQTGAMNEGDGDLFIKPTTGLLGLTALNWSTNTIAANQWYRIVETVKCGSFANVYVDGELWIEGQVPAVDSRFSLAPDPNIFGDDDAENALIFCAELALWNVALTSDQITQLGNATTDYTSIRDYKAEKASDLMANYPNPVSHNTIFPYQVQKTGNVSFRILDQTGKVIDVVNAGVKAQGTYNLNYNSDKLAKGIYSVQMTANNRTSVRKMVVIR